MKLLRFLIVCAPVCLLAGCILFVHQSRPYYHHELALSMKDGAPCFSIENDENVTNANTLIQYVSVDREANSVLMWQYQWKDAFTLASGECIQYGTNAGRTHYVRSSDNCAIMQDPIGRPLVRLSTGECFIDDHAAALEKDVTYSVSLVAYHKKNEDHSFSSYFCLSEDERGETVIHRLKRDRLKGTVEACPDTKKVKP